MDQGGIIQYMTDTFTGIDLLRPSDGPGAGDTFIYFDPQRDRDPAHSMPFATIVTKDYGEFDNTSHLDRPDVYRLNIGVSRDTFREVMGFPPDEFDAHAKDYDFAALDRLMPHPLYATQSYVSILNPSPATFETIKPLLAVAYERAAARHKSGQVKRD
ncbi:MAG TPA: DUF6194 family protein [Ktedonobacterales bacterium]